MIHNVEKALETLRHTVDFEIIHFTVAPRIDENQVGFHNWLIEFLREPKDLVLFEHKLDNILQELNSDYKAKRSNNLVMKQLKVKVATNGIFEKWLRKQNRLSAQSKIPKLSNNSLIFDEILSINE